MTQTHSRPRQQAEIAFAKAQSQFSARGRVGADIDPAARIREEKILRLRKARLEKESGERAKTSATLLSK